MKKNKTTKSYKKSYTSVKEMLKDKNSKIKLTPFNCNEAKFGKIITIDYPHNLSKKINIIFRRNDSSKKFFEGIENQIPNQILWNEEEQQAYFLNSDKQLYKILFEPIYMKKKEQTTEDLKKQKLKQEIESIAIPWSKFHNPNPSMFDKTYDTRLLTPMFIDLLDLIKEKKIKITCGVAMMHLLSYYANYSDVLGKIRIGGCEIIPELDFNLAKYDMWYEDVCLVGTSVPEKDSNINFAQDANELFKEADKKKSLWERIFGGDSKNS